MPSADCLHITLPAEPDSLPVARRAVAAHAKKLGVGEATIADLKTVVSEACANVIRHAYPGEGETGTLELDLDSEAHQLSVVVRDFGAGIRPLSSDDLPSLRLGLPIIGALSSRFDLVSVRNCGTQITVRFADAG